MLKTEESFQLKFSQESIDLKTLTNLKMIKSKLQVFISNESLVNCLSLKAGEIHSTQSLDEIGNKLLLQFQGIKDGVNLIVTTFKENDFEKEVKSASNFQNVNSNHVKLKTVCIGSDSDTEDVLNNTNDDSNEVLKSEYCKDSQNSVLTIVSDVKQEANDYCHSDVEPHKKTNVKEGKSHKKSKFIASKGTVKCDECDFITSTEQYISLHKKSKHRESWLHSKKHDVVQLNVVNCKFCNSKLLHAQGLYRHLQRKHTSETGYEEELFRLEKERMVKCTYCGTSFARVTHLKRHIKDVHEYDSNSSLKCEVCDLILKNKSTYEQHMKYSHELTEKKCLCTTCGQMYKTNGQLFEHVKNTHGSEKFFCDVDGCDFVCNSKKYLNRHKKSKHGEATLMCAVCAHKFKNVSKLNIHVKLVHNSHLIKKHKCPECNKEFNLKSNMKKHLNGIHKKIYSFKCNSCEKGFYSSKSLKQHIYTHHSSEAMNV